MLQEPLGELASCSYSGMEGLSPRSSVLGGLGAPVSGGCTVFWHVENINGPAPWCGLYVLLSFDRLHSVRV